MRDNLLKYLGYYNYSEYLKSNLWLDIRSRVLLRDKNLCKICNQQKACSVHHKNYSLETLKGFDLTGLISVCFHCHEAIEFQSNGRKRKLTQANNTIGLLQQSEKNPKSNKVVLTYKQKEVREKLLNKIKLKEDSDREWYGFNNR